MKTSENGILFIKNNEGFVAKISNDVGHLVIGHGHDLTPQEIAEGTFANGIDLAGADRLLRADLTQPVRSRPPTVPPPDSQPESSGCLLRLFV